MLFSVLHLTRRCFGALCLLWAIMNGLMVVHAQGGSDFGSFVQPGSGGADVDLHSGQFQFSMPVVTVPGAQGEGYTLSLGYRGPTPMEEASWVGYGWSLSPGSIVRQVNGIPDDFEDRAIININKHKPYTQFRVYATGGTELANVKIGAGGKLGVLIDSHRGVLPASGLSISAYGAGLSLSQTGSDVGVSFSFNPVSMYLSATAPGGSKENMKRGVEKKASLEPRDGQNEPKPEYKLKYEMEEPSLKDFTNINWSLSPLVTMSAVPNGSSTHSVAFSADFQADILVADIGPEIGLQGSYMVQKEDAIDLVPSFGYLHSHSPQLDQHGRMDFSQDMAGAIQKKDQYMPIPVANPDRFVVNAQGIGGVMRLYSTRPIQWRARDLKEKSPPKDPNANIGVEISLGGTVVPGITGSVGGNAGFGWSNQVNLTEWVPETAADQDSGLFYFAFDGDPGHRRKYDSQDIIRAEQRAISGAEKKELVWSENPFDYHNPYLMPSLTKSVKYNVNSSWTRMDALNRDPDKLNYFHTMDHEGLTEFEVTQADGSRYVFGLPVFVRNQGSLTLKPDMDLLDPNLDDQKVAFVDTADFLDLEAILAPGTSGVVDAETVMERMQNDPVWKGMDVSGTITPDAFAAEFLLTAIFSSDYRDLKFDGPSEDDLGAYVRFAYSRKYGGGGDWFKSRNPIAGMWFEEGSLSDPKDNRLTFSFAEREVFVLDTVETKTHMALFYNSERADNRGVADFRSTADGMDASEAGAFSFRCDSIQLFRKDSPYSVLLSTTRFDYDYSLCSDNPGFYPTSSGATIAEGDGKLTLKGVYNSSQNVVDTVGFIKFGYEYPAVGDLPLEVKSRYEDLFTDGHSQENDLDENPSFSHNHSNAWGYMRSDEPYDSDWRYGWEEAGEPKEKFDPAAFHLKQIHLASGGTVLPQYESGEYRFVQKEKVHTMVKVDVEASGTKAIALNLSGIEGLPSDWVAHLSDYFSEEDQGQVFFKFLYALGGTRKEFMTGFAHVDEVLELGGQVVIHLRDTGEFALPVQLCQKFARDFPRMAYGYDVPEEEDVLARAIEALAGGAEYGVSGNPCSQLEEGSFVRLPALTGQAVRGGAPRVKRLLHLDRGIEPGDAMLYGRQFEYSSLSSRGDAASGVAADLPVGLTEANPLFYPLPNINYKPNFINRMTAGRDLGHGSGPLGPSFMPAASVTYGEVVESKIHSGRSADGFIVNRFLTHWDHPYRVKATEPFDGQKDPDGFKRNIQVPTTPFSYSEKTLYKTQGYRIWKSSLPGAISAVVTYGGNLSDAASWVVSSRTEYEYFDPFESVEYATGWGARESGIQPGHFEEVYHLGMRVKQESKNISASLDVGATATAAYTGPDPPPIGGIMPWAHLDLNKSELATHVTTTVVNLPATLKSVRTVSGSKEQVVQNWAFDPVTGQAVRTATTDGFTGQKWAGADTSFAQLIESSMVAHDVHPELGPRSTNDRKTLVSQEGELHGIQQQLGSIYVEGEICEFYVELLPVQGTSTGGQPSTRPLFDGQGWKAMENYAPGDELLLRRKQGARTLIGRARVSRVEGNRAYLQTWYIPEAQELPGFPKNLDWTASDVAVTILNSGKQNQLGHSITTINNYGPALSSETIYRTPPGIHSILGEMNAALPGTAIVTALHERHVPFSPWGDTLSVHEFSCTGGLNSSLGLCLRLEPGGRGYVLVGQSNCDITSPSVCNLDPLSDGPADSVGTGGFTIPIHHADGRLYGGSVGAFDWDGSLGAIVWRTPDNPDFPVVVFTPCEEWWDLTSVPDVVEAVASLWQDDLAYSFSSSGEDDILAAEDHDDADRYRDPWAFGLSGRWRPVRQLAYNQSASGIVSEAGTLRHSTESGLLAGFLDINHNRPLVDGVRWVPTSSTLAFDEHARPIESANALDHRSAQRFGLDDKLPIWTSRNASVEECFFESCENVEAQILTDSGIQLGQPGAKNLQLKSDTAHTGHASIKLRPGHGKVALPPVRVGTSMEQSGARLRFWVHDAAEDPEKKCQLDSLFALKLFSNGTPVGSMPVASLAQTGKWVLMESVLPAQDDIALGNSLQLEILYDKNSVCPASGSGRPDIYLDDIKLQPARSLMVCNVYDPVDYKVLAILDENHFATFRQYNLRNEHVRTLVETLEGVKTVGEQYLHQKNLD